MFYIALMTLGKNSTSKNSTSKNSTSKNSTGNNGTGNNGTGNNGTGNNGTGNNGSRMKNFKTKMAHCMSMLHLPKAKPKPLYTQESHLNPYLKLINHKPQTPFAPQTETQTPILKK